MTTIFYDGVDLHADCRVMDDGFPSSNSDDGNKIIITADKQMMYGISGRVPVGKTREEIEKLLREYMTEMHSSEQVDRTYWPKSKRHDRLFELFRENVTLILMTRTHALHIGRHSISPITGKPSYCGTSCGAIMGIWFVTKPDLKRTFELVNQVDGQTSAKFITARRDDLEPFVVE